MNHCKLTAFGKRHSRAHCEKSAPGLLFQVAQFSKALTSSSKGPDLQCTLGFHSRFQQCLPGVNKPGVKSSGLTLSGDLAVFQLLPMTSADIHRGGSCTLRWTCRVTWQHTWISLNVDEHIGRLSLSVSWGSVTDVCSLFPWALAHTYPATLYYLSLKVL